MAKSIFTKKKFFFKKKISYKTRYDKIFKKMLVIFLNNRSYKLGTRFIAKNSQLSFLIDLATKILKEN